jgi:hypothetical protein
MASDNVGGRRPPRTGPSLYRAYNDEPSRVDGAKLEVGALGIAPQTNISTSQFEHRSAGRGALSVPLPPGGPEHGFHC